MLKVLTNKQTNAYVLNSIKMRFDCRIENNFPDDRTVNQPSMEIKEIFCDFYIPCKPMVKHWRARLTKVIIISLGVIIFYLIDELCQINNNQKH